MFSGTEKFFRPGYRANLVSSWLPALEGVVPRLERGADVADVGCGHGAQAGEARMRGVFREAGFEGLRRAAETPFNLVLEARKPA